MLLKSVLTAFAISLVATVANSATYNISLILDGNVKQFPNDNGSSSMSVLGTITTTKDTGMLSVDDISGWSLTVSDGDTTRTTSNSNGGRFNGATNSFYVNNGELYSAGFWVGTWAFNNGVWDTTSVKFNIGDAAGRLAAEAVDVSGGQRLAGVVGYSAPIDGDVLLGVGQQGFLRIGAARISDTDLDDPSPVPLPASALLLLAGLGFYAGTKRRA